MTRYEKITEQIEILSKVKKTIETDEYNKAIKDGWVEGECKGARYEFIRLQNITFVVLSAEKQPKNRLVVNLLCIDGSEEYRIKNFVYDVYLTNRNMLESMYKAGEIIRVDGLSAYTETQTKKLLTGKTLIKHNNEFNIRRLNVEKPGRKKSK